MQQNGTWLMYNFKYFLTYFPTERAQSTELGNGPYFMNRTLTICDALNAVYLLNRIKRSFSFKMIRRYVRGSGKNYCNAVNDAQSHE